jgi:hypothetical protein
LSLPFLAVPKREGDLFSVLLPDPIEVALEIRDILRVFVSREESGGERTDGAPIQIATVTTVAAI